LPPLYPRICFAINYHVGTYGGTRYLRLVSKLKAISTEQADARSNMTGRIVDSYSNISTVKLFSHTSQEADYAQDSMMRFLTTVYGQMRLVTVINVLVQIIKSLACQLSAPRDNNAGKTK